MEKIRLAATDAKDVALPSKNGLGEMVNIVKGMKMDLLGMFILQFWNDLFMNCVIVIDISKRELFA